MYSAAFCNVPFGLQNHNVAFVIFSGEDHTLGLYSHHLSSLKVQDEGTFLVHELFGLVILKKSGDGLSFLCSEINYHSDEVT